MILTIPIFLEGNLYFCDKHREELHLVPNYIVLV